MCVVGEVKELCEKVGLEVETVLERRARNERLAVLRCRRALRRRLTSDTPVRRDHIR